MKKKLLKFLCTALMTVVCMSVNATIYHGYCGQGMYPENAEWFFDSATGCLTIKLVQWNGNTEINPYSDDYPQAPWWMYYEDVKSVVVGEGITNLPGWAFAMMDKCTSVTLPSTLTVIGKAALEECAFTSINLPEGLEIIGDYSLMSGAFSTVTIPSTVTYIGNVAFQDNDNLTTVTCLNPDPTTITFNSSAFQDCDNLTAIYVPAGSVGDYKTEWSDYSGIIQPMAATTTTFTYTAAAKIDEFEANIDYFLGATGVASHTFEGGTGTVIYDGTVTGITNYALCAATFTSLTIPNSVVWIGEGALEGCDQLTSLTIPNSVTHIGPMAMEACFALTTLSFPSNLKFIGDMAFEYSGLTSLSIPNGVTAICSNAFNACYDLETVTIPNSVVVISDQAFYDCALLATLSIGNSVTSIGMMAFDNCDALTSVTIPGSVEIIGEAAFSECDMLETVSIGEGVTTIDQSAFGDCGTLKTVVIPSTVTTINDAFPGSTDIEHIYCYASPTVTWTEGGIQNFMNGGATICHVPSGGDWSAFSGLNLTFDDDLDDYVVYTDGIDNGAKLTSLSGSQKNIVFNRKFPAGKKQTICLPFDNIDLFGLGTLWYFYEISGTTAVMMEETSGTLLANTPYIFEPYFDVTNITFLSVDVDANADPKTDGGSFTFQGTYEAKTWAAGNAELTSGIYGFLAKEYKGNSTGYFMKGEAGATIKPFRAYLKYSGDDLTGTTPARRISPEDLPETIEIKWLTAEGSTTSLKGISTISHGANKWYSLDGRELNGKPSVKGIYINNGRKYIVK